MHRLSKHPRRTLAALATALFTGDVPGTFTLSQSALTDTAGPNGGALSGKLDVTITDKGTSQVVYSGKLNAMTSKSLGTYAPGDAHTYQFVVSFPDGGTPASNTTGDNAYQGSSTSLTYDFTQVQ